MDGGAAHVARAPIRCLTNTSNSNQTRIDAKVPDDAYNCKKKRLNLSRFDALNNNIDRPRSLFPNACKAEIHLQ